MGCARSGLPQDGLNGGLEVSVRLLARQDFRLLPVARVYDRVESLAAPVLVHRLDEVLIVAAARLPIVGEIWLHLREKLVDRGEVLLRVDRDAQDGDALVPPGLLESGEVRVLLAAGHA